MSMVFQTAGRDPGWVHLDAFFHHQPTMPMATLQQTIAEKFLAELSAKGTVDAAKIEALRVLLKGDKKIKADELVKIFTTDGGDVA